MRVWDAMGDKVRARGREEGGLSSTRVELTDFPPFHSYILAAHCPTISHQTNAQAKSFP